MWLTYIKVSLSWKLRMNSYDCCTWWWNVGILSRLKDKQCDDCISLVILIKKYYIIPIDSARGNNRWNYTQYDTFNASLRLEFGGQYLCSFNNIMVQKLIIVNHILIWTLKKYEWNYYFIWIPNATCFWSYIFSRPYWIVYWSKLV